MFGDFQVLCLVFTHFQGIEMKLSALGFKDFQLQVLSRTAGTLDLFAKNKKQKITTKNPLFYIVLGFIPVLNSCKHVQLTNLFVF